MNFSLRIFATKLVRKSFVIPLLNGAWCLGSHAAVAADSPETAPEADAALQDIVVTAQRRSQRLEEVPMAITAISADELESHGGKNVQDLTNLTSGVQINVIGSNTSIAIRGVS